MTTTRLSSATGRWIVLASVLGSGAVFLESSVVSVALPAIGRDLHLSIAGLEWVVNAFLLTLSALMLLGGAIGDRADRGRVFAFGALAFAGGCALAAIAPTGPLLFACRLLQGAAGALLVPNSLALLEASFTGSDRGAAIGRWAAWSAVTTALGPFVGGALVRTASWRWVFAAVVPFAIGAALIAFRHVPKTREDASDLRHVDFLGAAIATASLAGITWALVEGPERGWTNAATLGAGIGGGVLAIVFVIVEQRERDPLLQLSIFRSRQFSGANATTLLVYAALGAMFFLLMLELQTVLGYDALRAGAALLPLNAIMLVASPITGRLASRVGARWPMTLGAFGAAAGMALFARVGRDATYFGTVLPALLVFAAGLSTLVAPLTTAVLGAVDAELAGTASAVNNAVARLAGLLAVALIPAIVGIAGSRDATSARIDAGFPRAMLIGAALCALGGIVAWMTIRDDVSPERSRAPHRGER